MDVVPFGSVPPSLTSPASGSFRFFVKVMVSVSFKDEHFTSRLTDGTVNSEAVPSTNAITGSSMRLV